MKPPMSQVVMPRPPKLWFSFVIYLGQMEFETGSEYR